jgi:hypothetical protein
MGEAKRRKLLAQRYSTPEHRADIARVVRSVDLETGGGVCVFRAVMGQRVLAWLGIRSTVVMGAMLYRAGPDEIRDTLAFCGPGNGPAMTDDGMGAHCWLHAGEDLIDFSVGDWQQQSEAGYFQEGNPLDAAPSGEQLGPIQWTVPRLPEFWWQPHASLTEPWHPIGTPELGAAWYRPAPIPQGLQEKVQRDSQSQPVRWLSQILYERTQQIIADWQSGNVTEFTKKTAILSQPLARHGRDVGATVQRITKGKPYLRVGPRRRERPR